MTRGWRLTGAQWALLAEDLRHTDYPPPLRVTTRIRSAAARSRVRDELEAGGTMRSGRVDADLESALRLLYRPALWLDSLWLPDATAERPVRLLAAQSGRSGVCAVQHPGRQGTTLVEFIPAGGLGVAVVARLPAARPGRKSAATVPPDDPRARADGEEPGSVLVSGEAPIARPANGRAAAAEIIGAPHTRAGQIAGNVRDPSGTVRRSPLLRWYDNEGDGRYQASLTSRGWLEVAPADAQRLGQAADRLLAFLTRD
ncbi:MAG: ESX secretion-associated protein EspG [Pseudonocardiaceae bacterium]